MLRSKNLSILTSILITLHGVLASEDAVSIATSVAGGEPATLNLGGGITSSSNGEATETAIVAASSTTTGNGEAVITTAPAGDLSTVSIDAAPGYQIAGSCVKDCLFGELEGEPDGLMLPLELGCYSTYYNGCYCTAAVANEASSILSSCIQKYCVGTSQIPDALSIYDNYCTSAGYPRNVIAQTTATANNNNNNNGQTTVVTGDVVYTFTIGSSTLLLTEPGLQTITTPPSQSSSTSNSGGTGSGGGSGGNKVNIAGIVGGVLGALVLIAILLAIFLIWLPRHQKKKAGIQGESGPVGGAGSTFVPAAAAAVKKGGGRPELQGGEAEKEKGTEVGVGEREVKEEVVSPVSPQGGKVEIDGRGVGGQGEGRYGLRPEELDSEGRYVGELHGDGRQFGGVELEGSEVVR